MRICSLISITPRYVGGAERSLQALLRRLQTEFGHECRLIGTDAARWQGSARGLAMETCRDADEVRARVTAARPDVILSGLLASHAATPLAARLGVPHVAWCQSFEYCPPSAAEREWWGVSLERTYPDREARALVTRADVVLANSRFLRARLERVLDVACSVMYPEFEPDRFLIGRRPPASGTYVTGICGQAYKGATVFLELARRLPDVPFLLVGAVTAEFRPALELLPNVRVLPVASPRQLLAMSRIVLVPSRWPEPFGRIVVEAMANGIPTLASRTGGLPEAVAGSRPLSVAAFRSADAWLPRVRALLESEEARALNAREGLRASRRWLHGRSTRDLDHRLRQLVGHRAPRRLDRRPAIAIQGSQQEATAFSMINRHWHDALDRRGRVRVAADDEGKAETVDVTVHHDFSVRFGTAAMPLAGQAVAVRTWDFGPFPAKWVRIVAERYDELWVHTRWIRDQAVRAGIPAARIRVIPLGYDAGVFRPEGPAWTPTTKGTRFVFVGAPVLRKGIDILLRAWRSAFTRQDDVSLVIKTNPRDLFYEGIDWRAEIRTQAADPAAAEIVLVDELLSVSRLAALYRGCHAAVFPYRAEGFGLPILEAMASGCPPIVPRFGACLDVCSSRSAYFVAPRRIQLPVNRRFSFNTLGFDEEIAEVDFCEVPVHALAEALVRVAHATARERHRMGRAAAARAKPFTWDASAAAIEHAVMAMARRTVPVRSREARRALLRDARRRAAARSLYSAGGPKP